MGTHVITAQYNGYQIYETSTTAASISQVVDKAPLTVTALNMFRTVNTANPDPFPYQITGYQNGQTLATSGVTGTPVLTTDATLSSPVGNYISCALGSLAASNYSFTLENGTLTITDLACQVGVLKLGANGGINPATGVAWALGDRYRLIFVTSADTACDSTDITTYNSFVQGLAAASTSYPKLGSVTWKVVGSTASVDARDNTSTNPSVNGVGEPILRMDGLFVIANNYADLWDGAINSSHVPGQNYLAVAFDENGVERIEERVRTGSSGNGTATSVLGGSGDVQTGRNYTPDFYGGYGGWMQDWSASAASAGPVYAMSETLTIQSTNPADPYGNWASTQGLTGTAGSSTDPAFDADPNKDGVANGLVWLIGGADANPLANNNAILPVPTADGGKLVLTFKCLKSSARGTANLTVEYSMDLGGAADAWHPVSVPDADQADGGSGVGFVVTPIAGSDYNNVTATIAAPALGSKLFGRLMATE